jgi:pilus assembly protein CpaF
MDMQKLFNALGPLAGIFQEDEITEIMVDAPDQVYVIRQGQIEDVEVCFDPPEALREMIDAVLALAGTSISEGRTTADVRLMDNSRFVAVVPPSAVDGPYVMIRKPFIGGMTWEKLIEYRAVDQSLIDIFDSAITARKSILISGGTSSGKTTLLNLIAGRIPQDQRIVAVERTHDLRIEHPRVIYLEAQSAPEPMEELIEIGSRIFPGWIVVHELKGPETLKALQVLNDGYEGMCNMHADSIQEAFSRLESYCLMANQGLVLTDIKRMLVNGIHLAIQIQRLPNGVRRFVEMVEVEGIESGRYLFQPLTRYHPEEDTYEVVAQPSWAVQG